MFELEGTHSIVTAFSVVLELFCDPNPMAEGAEFYPHSHLPEWNVTEHDPACRYPSQSGDGHGDACGGGSGSLSSAWGGWGW